MEKWKVDPLALSIWILCSLFLLLVQFGYISPYGIIVISYTQYTWVFWLSIITFTISTAYLVSKIPRYARWSIGYSGEIVRTVKSADSSKDYFIRGNETTPLKEVLHKTWPFKDKDQDSKWYVVDELGNDVTSTPLGSIEGTVSIVFLKEN
ncbi:MAG: hypothetical protein OEV85_01120 [Candidatus Thorarchaeota archaeon]|nr:hypothetical protein [Candidatus Thorarchaeota archaeon]